MRKNRLPIFETAGLLFFLVVFISPISAPAQSGKSETSNQRIESQVPFVGCKSDGQAGPIEAPKGKVMVLPLTHKLASQLAYYRANQSFGVLAPREWYCFATYGSSGGALYVSSEHMDGTTFFTSKWTGFTDPVIEIADEVGDTSGRFGVARTIARVFPAYRAFAEKVIAEGTEPAESFPFGPYPKDNLIYRGNRMVEFETPANTDGLGTNSRLAKNASPIRGVAILTGQTPDLVQLSIRLAPNQGDLADAVIQQVEREALSSTEAQ